MPLGGYGGVILNDFFDQEYVEVFRMKRDNIQTLIEDIAPHYREETGEHRKLRSFTLLVLSFHYSFVFALLVVMHRYVLKSLKVYINSSSIFALQVKAKNQCPCSGVYWFSSSSWRIP